MIPQTIKTGEIIENFSKKDPRIIHVSAREKPEQWMGKNWACMEGFKKATGEIMLFTDADTKFKKKCDDISSITFTIRKILMH